MFPVQDYFQTARENEAVFRNILKDLKINRAKRPMGVYVPEDLETESSLDIIFDKYSKGNRYGKFTITNFTRPQKDATTIEFKDVATLSGGGAELEYLVQEDDSVEFQKAGTTFMS